MESPSAIKSQLESPISSGEPSESKRQRKKRRRLERLVAQQQQKEQRWADKAQLNKKRQQNKRSNRSERSRAAVPPLSPDAQGVIHCDLAEDAEEPTPSANGGVALSVSAWKIYFVKLNAQPLRAAWIHDKGLEAVQSGRLPARSFYAWAPEGSDIDLQAQLWSSDHGQELIEAWQACGEEVRKGVATSVKTLPRAWRSHLREMQRAALSDWLRQQTKHTLEPLVDGCDSVRTQLEGIVLGIERRLFPDETESSNSTAEETDPAIVPTPPASSLGASSLQCVVHAEPVMEVWDMIIAHLLRCCGRSSVLEWIESCAPAFQSAASLIIQRIDNGIGYSTSWARGWLLAGRACFAAPHAPQYMVEKGVSALFYHSGGWGPVLHLSTAVGLRTWCRPSFCCCGRDGTGLGHPAELQVDVGSDR